GESRACPGRNRSRQRHRKLYEDRDYEQSRSGESAGHHQQSCELLFQRSQYDQWRRVCPWPARETALEELAGDVESHEPVGVVDRAARVLGHGGSQGIREIQLKG